MSSGLTLVYNMPIVLITILLFFSFWVYFKLFSSKIETILVRNFGDNLKDLYWLRKGKRFLLALTKITALALFLNIINYSLFFYILFNEIQFIDSLIKSPSFNWSLTISVCTIVVIAWLFFVNWCVYITLFVHSLEKSTKINIDFNHLKEIDLIENLYINNAGKKLFFKEINKFKIKKFKKTISKKDINSILKSSLILIEFYALMMDNPYLNKINNSSEFIVNASNNVVISKKEFIILVNGFFNDSIDIEIRENKKK